MQAPIDTLTEEQFVRCANGLANLGDLESAELIRIRLLAKYPQGRFTETVYAQLVADPAGLSALFAAGYRPLVDMAQYLAAADEGSGFTRASTRDAYRDAAANFLAQLLR